MWIRRLHEMQSGFKPKHSYLTALTKMTGLWLAGMNENKLVCALFLMDIPTRKLFFNAYILSYFDYCSTIWGHASSEIMTRMLKLQKKCARYILDADISHPSIDLYRQLKWLPFENRVSFKTAIMMYKTIYGLNPRYMKSMLSFCTQ